MPNFRSYIKVNKIGDWAGVLNAFSSMGFDIARAARSGQEQAARRIIKTVKTHLDKQDLPWPALSENTLKRKDTKDMLIHTRLYYESINYWWENKVMKAGVKRGLHYDNDKEISNVAALLEYGTKNMPARPLWGPSIEELGNSEGLRDIVAEAIVRKLQRTFAGTPAYITKDWVLSYY